MKLIDKDALVAEVQKRRNKHFNSDGSPSSEYCHEDDEILGIIDTLEVKEMDSNDAFIEKACEFISFNIADYIDVTHHGGIERVILQERVIEEFKKYMKGE